jgi:hypothetical protein
MLREDRIGAMRDLIQAYRPGLMVTRTSRCHSRIECKMLAASQNNKRKGLAISRTATCKSSTAANSGRIGVALKSSIKRHGLSTMYPFAPQSANQVRNRL